jgi:hypothetical protein
MRGIALIAGLLLCLAAPRSAGAQLAAADERAMRVMFAAARATGAADGKPEPVLEYCSALRVLGAAVTEALLARRAAMSAPSDTSSNAGCFDGIGDHYRVLREFSVVGDSAFILALVRRGQTSFLEEVVLSSGGSGGLMWFVVSRVQRAFVFEHDWR